MGFRFLVEQGTTFFVNFTTLAKKNWCMYHIEHCLIEYYRIRSRLSIAKRKSGSVERKSTAFTFTHYSSVPWSCVIVCRACGSRSRAEQARTASSPWVGKAVTGPDRAVGAECTFGTTGWEERASPSELAARDDRRIDRADVFNAGIRRSDPVKPAASRVFHCPRRAARPAGTVRHHYGTSFPLLHPPTEHQTTDPPKLHPRNRYYCYCCFCCCSYNILSNGGCPSGGYRLPARQRFRSVRTARRRPTAVQSTVVHKHGHMRVYWRLPAALLVIIVVIITIVAVVINIYFTSVVVRTNVTEFKYSIIPRYMTDGQGYYWP